MLTVPKWYRFAMALNLRLTHEEDHQLSDLAASSGLSKQRVISMLIRREWETEQARLANSRDIGELMSERNDLMQRLKNA